jgi:hypothetical protein
VLPGCSRDERSWPQPFEDVLLGHRVGTVLDQQPQEIERLRREADLLTAREEPAFAEVDHEITKRQPHHASYI